MTLAAAIAAEAPRLVVRFELRVARLELLSAAVALLITELRPSRDYTLSKISGRHNLSVPDVEDILEGNITSSWNHDEAHGGWRLIVRSRTRRGLARIILRPIDEESGIWTLSTAYIE